MAVKKLRPTSPGQRHAQLNKRDILTKKEPERSLIEPIKKTGGRNNYGRMTNRHIGGGHKRKYRRIDFKRDRRGDKATVESIEYDPNRSAFISLVRYPDGEARYILYPNGLQVGATVQAGENVPPEVGNALPLGNIPLGTIVHNIEMQPGSGGKIARSAGGYAQIVAREGKYVILKMPSSETRLILKACYATIGTVGNTDHELVESGKAGRSRWLGRRPRTRGVAMNPVDHPMGGGEGRASGGHPRSRKGLYTKGKKTRKPNKSSNRLIVERRKK
jgi:large subunit ribosomal protein L2